MSETKFYELKMHETIIEGNFEITKVMDGWIYTYLKQSPSSKAKEVTAENSVPINSVFVPEDKDSTRVTKDYLMKVLDKVEKNVSKLKMSSDLSADITKVFEKARVPLK